MSRDVAAIANSSPLPNDHHIRTPQITVARTRRADGLVSSQARLPSLLLDVKATAAPTEERFPSLVSSIVLQGPTLEATKF